MLPTTGPVEIIWPVKEDNSLAETLKSASIIWSIELMILTILLSKVPNAAFQVIPSQSNTWVGSHTDLSSLTTKPALHKSALTARALMRQLSLSWTIAQPSSKKMAIQRPCTLQYFSKGFKTLVKTHGAEDRPNGSTVKTKYFLNGIGRTPWKLQKSMVLLCKVYMMVTTFEIEGKHEPVLHKIKHSNFPVLILNTLLN